MHSPGGVLFKVALKKFTNSQENTYLISLFNKFLGLKPNTFLRQHLHVNVSDTVLSL